MNQSVYSEIPDTTDSCYWLAIQHLLRRSITFVPRDKGLNQYLEAKAWEIKQATLSKKAKTGSTYWTDSEGWTGETSYSHPPREQE